MGRTGSATGEWNSMEASRDRQGGAEDPGHQLVSRVCMYGRAAGVSLILPSTVLCAGRDMRRFRASQCVVLTLYQQVMYLCINSVLILNYERL